MSRYWMLVLVALTTLGDGAMLAQKRPYAPPVIIRGPNGASPPRPAGVPTNVRPRTPANDNRRAPATRPTAAGARSASASTVKPVIPPARSPQVVQARATARQNYQRWRNALRLRLQARLRAQRAQAAAVAAKDRAEEERQEKERREREAVLMALRLGAGAEAVTASVAESGGGDIPPGRGSAGGAKGEPRKAANDNIPKAWPPFLGTTVANTFKPGTAQSRRLTAPKTFYRYHGTENATGRRIIWITDKRYATEAEMRVGLAIRRNWGVKIDSLSRIEVPVGEWVEEGLAADQGDEYKGGDYQAVLVNMPASWIKATHKPFE
jgi:hypothetical protein